MSSSFARRAFLRNVGGLTGLLAMGGLLQACATTAPAAPTATTAAAPPAPSSPPALPLGVPSPAASPALAPSVQASAVATSATQVAPVASSVPNASAAFPLTVVYSTIAGPYFPLWVAADGGIFDRNGLNVNVLLLTGASVAMAALLSDQAQIFQAGGSDVISAVVSGADLTILGTVAPFYPYVMEAQPSVASVADLKGKKVGIGSVGDTSDIATRLVLQQAGLDPNNDVAIISLGSVPQRTAALLTGQIDATMDSPPDTLTLEAAGMHPIVDAAALKLPASNQVMAAKSDWLNSHRPEVQQYIDSMVEAVAKARQDKAFTIAVMKKYLQNNDEAAIEDAYTYSTQESVATLPYADPAQFTDSLNILSQSNPKVSSLDISSIIDNSFVKSADDRGLAQQTQP